MTGGGFLGSTIALVDAGLAVQVVQDIADEFNCKGFDQSQGPVCCGNLQSLVRRLTATL